ncbi:energy-coupling factor transporter transmembrane component T family protein [Desulforamulus putei]|uniref:Energy-coupling factor transport system permease protein n=1 Tax=Desulforamulus putei DSM 12395 TaxID=1121429 RepID=A0A1M4Y7T4_9FIRM|nr:energy-coupling factor transporter transmembrane component T [Desulforamulus putei]SHF01740.1 energy-coupling factor transport system permease protein [Desulforamulus putei DSM 12395]
MARVIEYVYRESVVHSLNPLSKLAWALGVMFLALAFNNVYYLLTLLSTVVAVALLGKVLKDLATVFKGLTVFAGILVLLQVIFFQGEEVLFYLLPGHILPVTGEALYMGLAMAVRMMAVVLSFIIFLATTQYKDIILVLTEKLKLPYDYVFMFMTALRFVPTFMAEAVQVRYAQQVRGCPVDSGNPLQKIKAYATVALPLVLISLKKAERLAIAMETRGYGSGIRTYYKEPAITKLDMMVILSTLIFIVLALFLRMQGYGVVQL